MGFFEPTWGGQQQTSGENPMEIPIQVRKWGDFPAVHVTDHRSVNMGNPDEKCYVNAALKRNCLGRQILTSPHEKNERTCSWEI